MVSEKIRIRDKWKLRKKFMRISVILLLISVVLLAAFLWGFFKGEKKKVVLENPLKDIVFLNTNAEGKVNKEVVIEQAILEFNEEYINYILIALGIGNLHKSRIGYGNPVIELVLDEEIWNFEIVNGALRTKRGEVEDEDLKIIISKKEAIEALLSPDIRQFMKDSVYNGETRIEIIAGKVELVSKGYLAMYKELTGEEIEVNE